ncbi:unnamed protein product [Bursaphelenchus okinawaensis]|uniref:Ground-like domain-containing protein n=1 Tax=Bursaphelenchus okinawaensis TaxID=465554 RepID=A0A811KJH3_9BILA|nr:unnamed protein product [Bursaphelenchus okinawaensis]CAG9104546.1 unnamed protein product [Bursaphelenchus okinawaensis]
MFVILLLLPVFVSSLGTLLGQCGLFSLPTPCPPVPTCYAEPYDATDGYCCEAVCKGLPVPAGCADCAVRRKPRTKRPRKRPKRAITRFKPTVDSEQPAGLKIDEYRDFDELLLPEGDYVQSRHDDTCNSEKLRKIIKQGRGQKTVSLKHYIQRMAEEQLDEQYNVICGKGQFSYITTTDEFCQDTVDDTTCYLFKRNKHV